MTDSVDSPSSPGASGPQGSGAEQPLAAPAVGSGTRRTPSSQGPLVRLSRRQVLVGLGGAGLAAGLGAAWWLTDHPKPASPVSGAAQQQSPFIYRGHQDAVTSVAWSPDGSRIASASLDKTVQIWEAHSGTRLLTYRGHQTGVISVAWSPDGTCLVSNESPNPATSTSSVAPRTIRVWEATSGKTLLTYTQVFNLGATTVWSPDGTRIASAGVVIEVWDATRGQTLLRYDPFQVVGGVDVSWSPDGQRLAVAGDTVAQAIDARTGALYRTYGRLAASFYWTIAWSPNGASIASGGPAFQSWDAATGKEVFADQPRPIIKILAWSPDSQRLVAANTVGGISVWNVAAEELLYTYTGHQPNGRWSGVEALAWSPDGTRIASGGTDTTVQIWRPSE